MKTTLRPLTRVTFNGTSIGPSISPDGKLLAYQASVGGPNPEVWVQQIGGGQAIQITHEKEGALYPVFSPDGTQIAYHAQGGIYEVSSLGGDARLITSDGLYPSYAAGGSTILFWRQAKEITRTHLFTIPRLGGTPVEIQLGLEVEGGAISPDGSKLLALAYRPDRMEQDLKRWRLIPISGGKLEEVAPTPLLPGENYAPFPSFWTTPDRNTGRQWIIFQRKIGDTYNLFRVAVTGDGKVTSDPEQLTFSTGFNCCPDVSENGRMVFNSGTIGANLWSIPINTNRAQLAGDRQSLTQVEGVAQGHPSLSRDGRRVVFTSYPYSASHGNMVVKDLATGRETQLTQALDPGEPSISPDGSFVVYDAFGKSTLQYPDIYSIPTAGGAPRLICRECGGAKGLSSDGSRLLIQTGYIDGYSRIAQVDLATGKVTGVLSDPQYNLWHPYYSWDDKWIGFKMQTGVNHQQSRLYVTPVENFVPAGAGRWIQLTSGDYNDDKPQFSPDGNTMYFTSNRDGSTCFWALRLDPKTKRPLGAPFPVQHFHGAQRAYQGVSRSEDMEISVAKDKIVTILDELHVDIWMMDLEPHQ